MQQKTKQRSDCSKRQALWGRSIIKYSMACLIVFWGMCSSSFAKENFVVFGSVKATSKLHIYSSFDLAVFAPLLNIFVQQNPHIAIQYQDINTSELYEQVRKEQHQPKASLIISSAMDLQIKLVNDGLAQTYISPYTEAWPESDKWRNQIFSFSLEPVVMVVNNQQFPAEQLPKDRSMLLQAIRRYSADFIGKIGTYDIRKSGAGYLFASQDSRQADATWGRLLEAFGSHDVQTYCCTGQIIEDLKTGKLAVGYNLVGAYAYEQVKDNSQLTMIMPSDYTLLLRRTALIPNGAPDALNAHRFLDFLLSNTGQSALRNPALLSPLSLVKSKKNVLGVIDQPIRVIELDQQLLVGRDFAKYTRFIKSWEEALELNNTKK